MRDCDWVDDNSCIVGESPMKVKFMKMPEADRLHSLRQKLQAGSRLGLITSIDGAQIVTVVLNPQDGTAELWETPVTGNKYKSLTSMIPLCHWMERTMWDMFGLVPEGHPRLKHNLLHEPYDPDLIPLRKGSPIVQEEGHRNFKLLEVRGDGPYEVAVGPIHAGVIEPGHFRFSCLGEIILNLEIHLGYVHRGVEKRMTEVPWRRARFVAEAAASDMSAAYALAHSIAIESICGIGPPIRAQYLRTLALEIERVTMHTIDLGGIAGDIGFLAISSAMSRLRGDGLGLADMLAGSRFLRAYILPGGVSQDPGPAKLAKIAENAATLRKTVLNGLHFLMEDPVALDRMINVGRLAPNLAADFGIVGVGGRAAGQAYDTRNHFEQGLYPFKQIPIALHKIGDVHCRAKVRIDELRESLILIEELARTIPDGPISVPMPNTLPAHEVGLGIVESHRGEVVHLVVTDDEGQIMRYAIKDPSVNNWTAVAIANRNGLLADFPLVNKSFALSYSGHDL
jgi:Ni,Fe-hydrogenase III large subunit